MPLQSRENSVPVMYCSNCFNHLTRCALFRRVSHEYYFSTIVPQRSDNIFCPMYSSGFDNLRDTGFAREPCPLAHRQRRFLIPVIQKHRVFVGSRALSMSHARKGRLVIQTFWTKCTLYESLVWSIDNTHLDLIACISVRRYQWAHRRRSTHYCPSGPMSCFVPLASTSFWTY